METNEQLKQAREGTYRSVEQTEIEDLGAQWGMDFQLINRENIAREAFPDVWGELEPFGDEAVRAIIRSKKELSSYVIAWLERAEIASIKPNTPDFDALLGACPDEYLVSNPEISDGWKEILAELEVIPNQAKIDTFGALKRRRSNDPQRKLSAVFEKYLKVNSDLSKSAQSEFGTGVRRFIEFHGDLDIDQIERSHAEQFRNGLARLPVRPPNKVRASTMPQQLDWAMLNETKTLQTKAINKNILAVKLALDFGFHKTSLIEDRTWRNPFEGFQEGGKKGRKSRPKGFSDEQVQIVFSKEGFKPRTEVPLVS